MKFLGVVAILAAVATVVSADEEVAFCTNAEGEFTFQLQGEDTTSTCAEIAQLPESTIDQRCNKGPVFDNCPNLCNPECCVNNQSIFTYKSGPGNEDGEKKSISCKQIFLSTNENFKTKKCNKDKIFKECPGVCNPECRTPTFSCVDFDGKFDYIVKGEEKKTKCEKVEAKPGKKCNKLEVLTNCPGACDENCDGETGVCENFAADFVYTTNKGQLKNTSCGKIAESDAQTQKKRCQTKEVRKNCPGICDKSCTAV